MMYYTAFNMDSELNIWPVTQSYIYWTIVNNLNLTQLTRAIFCDLSKAFDTISTEILPHKLNIYGKRGLPNKLIDSYLKNITQNRLSCITRAICSLRGTPGFNSQLSPLSHIYIYIYIYIYTNDISSCTTVNIVLFVDDTTVFLSDSNPHSLFNSANLSLEEIFYWFCENTTTTQSMLIQPVSKFQNLYQYKLSINGNTPIRANSC